jgi:uncharacterized membrane protein YkvA (DUF1232 family)
MVFNKSEALKKAQSLSTEFDAQRAQEFAQNHQESKWYDDFILLLNMLVDDEFHLNTTTYLSIAGAIAYTVMPLDLIPDFIPGVGFIDDLFVIGFVMKNISDDIQRYKEYIQLKLNI